MHRLAAIGSKMTVIVTQIMWTRGSVRLVRDPSFSLNHINNLSLKLTTFIFQACNVDAQIKRSAHGEKKSQILI
jgi:hypothetical protein